MTDREAVTKLPDAIESNAVSATAAARTSESRSHSPLATEPSAPVQVDDAPFSAGMLLSGRYRIVRLLGRGGMGVVYQADDLRLGHPVALKFLPPALARDPRRLAQFHNEVSLARQVSHPNVCRVYDIGDVDGHPFLSMEYVDGEDLAAALRRRGPFPEDEAVELTRQICAGLGAVHARRVLHRDLKPANIMLNKAGQAQLMDFGIAAAGHIDEVGRISEGTPAYMAPEQLVGADVTVQSDVYALGLVMYEIVTGHRLFNANTLEELLAQQDSLPTGVPTDLAARARPRLQQTILQCLERDPSRRPVSAQAVAAVLQTVLLDAHATWRRILQIVTQVAIGAMLIAGLRLLATSRGTSATIGLLLIFGSVVLVVAELRYPLGWTVSYKGHRVRFSNHAMFGERLYIDGALADRGRFGVNVTLRGTIESGAGAGERITARVRCGFVDLSCRIVAESFTSEGSPYGLP